MQAKSPVRFSSAQALFTFAFLIFFFTLLNGYLQNLVAGYRADAWLVLIALIIELIATLILARRWVHVDRDWLEIVGFLIVVIAAAIYFIVPALPTLLPPTKSSDAVRVYLQVLFTFPNGTLVSWYPAGGTFLTAMFSHWLNIEPLRVLHPVAVSFIALSAGAIYGMACALLPQRRLSKITALIAPALLFVPWSYFAGTLDWEQYFFAQVFAQYFILAAVWYIASYVEQPRGIFAVLIGAALLGVVAAYPIFVVLPLGLFGLVVLARLLPAFSHAPTPPKPRNTIITLIAFIGLMILAAAALVRGGILEFAAGKLSVTGDVGQGGVTNPSLDNLGGPIFLALVLIGAWLAWRANVFGKTILGLLAVWIFQLVALLLIQPFLQLSAYRVDKTFYILVFPFAILATLPIAYLLERFVAQIESSPRRLATGLIALAILLGGGVFIFRPPKSFSPLTESEIQIARWAKNFYMETYSIAYLDQESISAYWLTFGIWRETVPDEWFQWIPAGRKMGPATFDEWLADPGWHDRLLVRYLDEIPAKLRVIKQIGDAAIIDKDIPPDYGPKPPFRSDMNFGKSLTLIGYDIPRTTFQPGETVALTTWTQSLYPPPATVAWRMQLVDRAGNVIDKIERDPFGNKYPLQRWAPGKYARDDWAFTRATNLAPGAYEIQLALFRRADGSLVDDVRRIFENNPPPMSAAPITRIKIPAPAPTTQELQAAKNISTRVGENFTLQSYALQTDRPSSQVNVTLYWQTLKPTDQNYTVFVHLLDTSGQVIAQQDAEPRGGAYPTSIWDADEIVRDAYTLTVPASAHAPFTVEIGMYSQPDQKRLPVGANDHLEFQITDF